ncbi:MAG: LCP family protein [Candidatus Eremiobacteraeota bacterium]|nr:LCP family protein [Candidatus Eremiobacteraeota bacterium]
MTKRILTVLAVLVAGTVATFAGYVMFEHKNPIVALSQMFVPSPQQVFGKSNLLVLVEGLDYDYTTKDEEFSTNSRSDVIWAVNLDFANKRVYQLSIPRDMVATLPNGSQAKINQAQSDGGVKEAKAVIAQWLGVPGFDRYAVLRIDATKAFVNAIGGVNVYVKSSDCLRYRTGCTGDSLDYDDSWGHLHIHLKEGVQHLDGERAVAYMRFRHDWCSDPCRIMRQQQVLHALVGKLKGDRVNTFLHLGDLISVMRKYVQTNFTDGELLSLATYFQGMPDSAIVTNQVPYTGEVDLPGYGDSLVPDTAERTRLVAAMLLSPPSPIPSPDAMALAAISPGTLRVDVENGSGVNGAASRVATVLRQAGFTIGEVGDADRFDYGSTIIRQHSNVTFAGAKVRSALPRPLRQAAVVPDATTPTSSPTRSLSNSDVTVIVGSDAAQTPAQDSQHHS